MKIDHHKYKGPPRPLPVNGAVTGPVLERTNGVPHGAASSRSARCGVVIEDAFEGYLMNPKPTSTAVKPVTPTLLGLPKRVRERIYAITLSYDRPLSVKKHSMVRFWTDEYSKRDRVRRTSWHFNPPLLRTCSQIQLEAAPIFFTSNVFVLDIHDGNLSDLLSWLTHIPRSYLAHVKRIVLNIEPSSIPDLVELAAKAADPEQLWRQAVAFTEAAKKAGVQCSVFEVRIAKPKLSMMETLEWNIQPEIAMGVADRWIQGLEQMLRQIERVSEMVDMLDICAIEDGDREENEGRQ